MIGRWLLLILADELQAAETISLEELKVLIVTEFSNSTSGVLGAGENHDINNRVQKLLETMSPALTNLISRFLLESEKDPNFEYQLQDQKIAYRKVKLI